MLALYRAGRQADALRAYDRLRATLVETLGVEPSGEVRDLQRRVLDHDASLLVGTGPVAERAAPSPVRATGVATVVVCDVVESTATMSAIGDAAADELRTALYRELRGAVERHGGATVKTLGDGVLALFRDSAVGAVDAAVESLAAGAAVTPPQVLRVGVATGEVSFSEDGDVHGRPVVEAARLCALAAPGTVLMTDVTRRVIGSRSAHDVVDDGTRDLRGIPEPIRIHRIGGDAPARAAAMRGTGSGRPRGTRALGRRVVVVAAVVLALVAAVTLVVRRGSEDEADASVSTPGSTPVTTSDAAPSTVATPSVAPAAATRPPTTAELGYEPELRPRACQDAEWEGDPTVTCWTLVVPMDRTNPAGRAVELPVVRAPAQGGVDIGVPTVLIGPDISVLQPLGSTLRQVGEQVSMVQRGQLASEPSLDCPETDAGRLARLAMPSEEARDALDAVFEQCRRRLADDGIAFDRFGADDVADDLRDLAIAMGVPQINVRSFMDFAHVTRQLVIRHSAVVRSIHLIAPRAVSTSTGITTTYADAWARYVQHCRESAACAPDADRLDDRLDDLLDLVTASPPLVRVTTFDGQTADLLLDRARAVDAIALALEDPLAFPLLAAELLDDDVTTTAAAFLASYWPGAGEPRSLLGRVLSCDLGPTTIGDLTAEAGASQRWGSLVPVDLPTRCAALGLELRSPDLSLPSTDIPVFVLGAELDPWSPPDAVRRLVGAAANATVLLLPGRNYRGLDWLSCVDDLREAFLVDPTAPLEDVDACAAAHEPIELLGVAQA